ncbi:hypothetical protein LQ327_22670 [Actinomycetospora endophytica]|uniref:Uncharacterized protein n=1 Tax=Actinomycetospora endophytica TaxID=2291215 RepID=A0ABS8PFI1_9PSEU|nr:hypothetical protein [Actinomycetospora endophytica]MCD2196181.1 hypothetical protein [Actinomycetospora endophytica]
MSIGQAGGPALTTIVNQATAVIPTRITPRVPHPTALAAAAQRYHRRSAFYEERTAAWSGNLSERFSDIAGVVSSDFGERFQSVLTDTERTIDSSDPFKDWQCYAAELDRRLNDEVWNNHQVAVSAVRSLSESSARYLALDETEVIDPPPPSLQSALASEAPDATALKGGRLNALINIVMRGYMGFMMLLMVSNLVLKISMSAWYGVLPFGLLAAVAWREERARRLAARRAEAQRLTRNHLDEFATRAMKDSQDLLRALEYGLRQAYRARVARVLATPEWR